jgi:hypothetical protein
MANEARKWYENTHHELLGDDGLLHGLHYSHSEFAGTEPQPPNKNIFSLQGVTHPIL